MDDINVDKNPPAPEDNPAENPPPAPEPAPTPPQDPMSDPKVKEEMEVRDTKIEDLETRMQTLQDSLDSAIEEMALKGEDPPADPIENPSGDGGTAENPSENMDKEIQASLREEEDFKEGMRTDIDSIKSEMEEIAQEREALKIEGEIATAMKTYPEADPAQIAYMIEQEPEGDVKEFARLSHENKEALVSDIKSKQEVEIKERLQKELAGGTSVPQSPGDSTARPADPEPGAREVGVHSKEDMDWTEAISKAKAETTG